VFMALTFVRRFGTTAYMNKTWGAHFRRAPQ
jgi:hypothetical protein